MTAETDWRVAATSQGTPRIADHHQKPEEARDSPLEFLGSVVLASRISVVLRCLVFSILSWLHYETSIMGKYFFFVNFSPSVSLWVLF